jgi:hypothetical protein
MDPALKLQKICHPLRMYNEVYSCNLIITSNSEVIKLNESR